MSSGWATAYLWIKALHVIAVISWLAGLLYLPRLFVYHCRAEPGSAMSETFKIMERRLAGAIMTPAMLASFVFGLLLLAMPGVAWTQPWLLLKLALVLVLAGLHLWMLSWRRAFEADRNQRSERFYRVANEVPTLLMIGIVVLVIVRPFG